MKINEKLTNLEQPYKHENDSHTNVSDSHVSNKNTPYESKNELIRAQFEQFALKEKDTSRAPSPNLTPRVLTQFKRFSGDPTESLRTDEINNLIKKSVLEIPQSKEHLEEKESIDTIIKLAQYPNSLHEAKTLLTKLYEKQSTLPPSSFSKILLSSTDTLWINTLLDLQFAKTKPTIEESTKTLFPLFEDFIEKTKKNVESVDRSRLLLKIIKICYPQSTRNTNPKIAVFNELAFCIYRTPTQDRTTIKKEILSAINFYKQGTHDTLITGLLKQIPDALKAQYKGEVRLPCKLQKDTISQLLFSQDSIDHATMEGMLLEELTENMVSSGWKKNTQLSIVKMADGKLISLDNRRLYAAKKACLKNEKFEMSAYIIDHSEKAPDNLFKGIMSDFTHVTQT